MTRSQITLIDFLPIEFPIRALQFFRSIETKNHFFTGFGSGLGTPAAYLILTDLSLIRFRGMMATLNSFSNNFAWLIGLVIGKYCPLNVVILTYAMSPALFLILSPFLPESAVWLTKKGLEEEAVKALRCVRGPDYPVQVRMGPGFFRRFKERFRDNQKESLR